MSEKDKNISEQPAAENNETEQSAPEKKKRRFTIHSPYADYAEDNDLCSEMMEQNQPDDVKPDTKQLLKTALYALLTVLFFVGATLICTSVYSCAAGSI